MKVTCSTCKNSVELKDGYLRQHRKVPGVNSKTGWCQNGGTSEAVNDRMVEGVDPGKMHEPKPYTGELDWSSPTEGIEPTVS